MKNKLNIFIVDDHNLFREGMSFLLANCDFVSNVYEAGNGHELLEKLNQVSADVILMDIDMPVMNGIEACAKVTTNYPGIKVITLSMHANDSFYADMIDAGAKGFLLKNSGFEEVKKAILRVQEDGSWFSPEILDIIIKNLSKSSAKNPRDELSSREVEVLFHICKGFSNQEIADLLFISKRTVDKHREHLLLKTASRNTAGLVVYAIRNKYFEV